jgi:hypothetical protein
MSPADDSKIDKGQIKTPVWSKSTPPKTASLGFFKLRSWLPRQDRHAESPVKLSDQWKALQEEVRYLVFDCPDFIVFIDHELDLDWDTSPELNHSLEERGNDTKAHHYKVLTQAAVVETMPSDGLNNEMKLRFKRLVGEAIVCCLEMQYENALNTLGFAREYLRDRTQETSRFWYLSSSMMWALPFGFVAGGFWMERSALTSFLGDKAFWLIIASCAGAIGALLSVMSRTGKLAFDSASGFRLHCLEALSRISVGALAGGLVGLAIQSKLFLSLLSVDSQTHVVMMIAAFVAGAGERLAPSIIAEFDNKLIGRDAEAAGRQPP